ncbi:MAG TPA: DUF2007 domain-containing protein [bacterium]|nr:DUF2007 domain-containing protein [bacterium]HQO33967.1 DUF2007 domain-containing protein [bacterium]
MADELKTVAMYDDPIQAELAKAQLEEGGIDCFLIDLTSHVYPLIVPGGVKVQVCDVDAARAKSILEKWERETVHTAESKDFPHCPDCCSQETHQVIFTRPLLALFLLTLLLFCFVHSLFVFLILLLVVMGREVWKCDQCGHRWRVAR